MKELIQRIEARTAIIGIIGLGYAGLPLVVRFGEERFRVLGFDIDPQKVDLLNKGKTYLQSVSREQIGDLVGNGVFSATSDFSRLSEVDSILICVPTPLTEKMEPDLIYIENTAHQVAENMKKGQLIILESTTYPGTTEEVLLPKFRSRGWREGVDFFLAYSPEREDPGNREYTTKSIPKVVGGITRNCQRAAKALYQKIIDEVVTVSTTRAAEMTKLLENIYRSVNIALVNELKILADRMGIDIWEVIEAASTKPFGYFPFYPGPGMGGHCIPIDPFYLSWKAREFDFTTRFIQLSGEINVSMPYHVVSKAVDALNARKKSVKGANILILGVAYKRDIDDIRESPALAIMKLLQDKGVKMAYNDPHVPKLRPTRKYNFTMSSKPLTEELLREMDLVMIITDHTQYDYQWIVNNASLVVDTRNATKGIRSARAKIIKA
ncbi:MAG: nucleotide sugar dehydrogenase [Deltaproteobacteria bacterium]|nr:nucleotide sugar dehydrogenase [Deltaproteobacteria bacterium]